LTIAWRWISQIRRKLLANAISAALPQSHLEIAIPPHVTNSSCSVIHVPTFHQI
jgi:hypothetical protein